MRYKIGTLVMYGDDICSIRHGTIKGYSKNNRIYKIRKFISTGDRVNDYVHEELIISVKPDIEELNEI